MLETELYPPVKAYFETRGYLVRGEVKQCDVAAVRTTASGVEELLVVELKTAMNLELILQGTQRQKAADIVYLAIPRPKRFWFDSRWRDIMHLLRRLELGLLLVDLNNAAEQVQEVIEPVPFNRTKSARAAAGKRKAIVHEARERSGDYTPGGSTRVPHMTVYRERAITIARAMTGLGPEGVKPSDLMGNPTVVASRMSRETLTAILYRNVYGWFERKGKGRYTLSGTCPIESETGQYGHERV